MRSRLQKRYGGSFYTRDQARTIIADECWSFDLQALENREYSGAEIIEIIIKSLSKKSSDMFDKDLDNL